ncbi:hypothetical protein LOK49_LG03G01276 [Camellia lanceoleosa]|uniref:Uncharacterized protein n=1 Tax=Camellia lanceoleosa TaxID=1840588 RepID=A0ACC0IJI0_9ERIC|nr:hypothetical protein LOK49_LG03G01276 [Camellia lanceoleosa]
MPRKLISIKQQSRQLRKSCQSLRNCTSKAIVTCIEHRQSLPG